MEMFVDERTLNWFPPNAAGVVDWSLLNPTYFYTDLNGKQYIPFKYHTPDSTLARHFFDSAQHKGQVGEARGCLCVTMDKNAFLVALLSGTVSVFSDRQSIGFWQALNATNYPSLARGEMTITLRPL